MQPFYSVSFRDHFISEEPRSLNDDARLKNMHFSPTWARFSWVNVEKIHTNDIIGGLIRDSASTDRVEMGNKSNDKLQMILAILKSIERSNRSKYLKLVQPLVDIGSNS